MNSGRFETTWPSLTPDLSRRHMVAELMDAPDIDADSHAQALAGLRRINFFSGTTRNLARHIQSLIASSSTRSTKAIRILDIGSGGGDVTNGVFNHLSGVGPRIELEGWDMSGTAVELANSRFKRKSKAGRLSFRVQNAFKVDEAQHRSFDFVYCSLFLHHFDDLQAAQLLSVLRSVAKVAVIVDDLKRTRLGWTLAQIGCRLLSRSPIVHFDGPQSVRAALLPNEVEGIMSRCGYAAVKSTQRWPQRFTSTGFVCSS